MALIFIYNITVNLTIFLTKMYHSVCLRLSCVVVVVFIIIGVMADKINNNMMAIVKIMINTLTLS